MDILCPQFLLLFFIFGSLAGFLAGLLGIGGGVILVPLFLWAFPLAGFDPEVVTHAAFGTSLAIIVPTAISSTFGHRKRGNVDWHQVAYLALGGVAGAVAGSTLAAGLSGETLKGLFGIMQIAVGLKMFRSRSYLPAETQAPVPPAMLLSVGLLGGCFSSFFGVGGGVITVPLLVILVRLPIHLAVGNSSALIVASSLFGALLYVLHGWDVSGLARFSLGYVNLLVALLVAPLTIILARAGVRVASRFSHDKLVKVFSCLLILVGLRLFAVYF